MVRPCQGQLLAWALCCIAVVLLEMRLMSVIQGHVHLQHEDAPLGGLPLLGVHIRRPNKIVYSALFCEAAADEADRLQVT